MRKPGRLTTAGGCAVALGSLALATSAFSSDPGSSPGGDELQRAIRSHVKCMRENGAPVPEPPRGGEEVRRPLRPPTGRELQALRRAARACERLLPEPPEGVRAAPGPCGRLVPPPPPGAPEAVPFGAPPPEGKRR